MGTGIESTHWVATLQSGNLMKTLCRIYLINEPISLTGGCVKDQLNVQNRWGGESNRIK